ncbi:hypothetical protein MAR_019548 [Mya arenaria]|uniref:C-type lectin domain-containing protein n=1 Tax=Mya arenaria TaxID=6604 RepID=A0ABY7E4Q9_MYAAR|nr:hypothetical protein MAR_019548 [Mya arenaria]
MTASTGLMKPKFIRKNRFTPRGEAHGRVYQQQRPSAAGNSSQSYSSAVRDQPSRHQDSANNSGARDEGGIYLLEQVMEKSLIQFQCCSQSKNENHPKANSYLFDVAPAFKMDNSHAYALPGNSVGPRVFHMSMPGSWHTAREWCRVVDSLLLPELSDRPLFLDQLKETLQPGDLVWINAKQLTIDLTYSYTLCATGGARISWREAAGACGSMGTWQVIEPSSARSIVGLLKDEMPVWLQKYRNNILPETESELCMGLERQTDGLFADRVDNCSNKHSFFCVRGPEMYSPTLTRLSEPVSVVTGHGDHDNMSVPVDEQPKDRESNADNEDTARPSLVFGVVGGMAALLVVLLVGFGARYVLSRYRLIQQYRKSRRRRRS